MTTKLPLVVCVDDEPVVLSTIVRCLRREGFDVRSTGSAREALGWIAIEEVAVLVSDYEMPEMNGAQLAGHARRIRPETVRILLTGKRTFETAVDGINQGEIFRFLEKPFEPEVLRQIVHAAIERNRELLAATGDRERRKRREVMREALEAEYPGISEVEPRRPDDLYELPADPWKDAAELGLTSLTTALER